MTTMTTDQRAWLTGLFSPLTPADLAAINAAVAAYDGDPVDDLRLHNLPADVQAEIRRVMKAGSR
jgi:hypothetical protein